MAVSVRGRPVTTLFEGPVWGPVLRSVTGPASGTGLVSVPALECRYGSVTGPASGTGLVSVPALECGLGSVT